jgi:hypothetical protein
MMYIKQTEKKPTNVTVPVWPLGRQTSTTDLYCTPTFSSPSLHPDFRSPLFCPYLLKGSTLPVHCRDATSDFALPASPAQWCSLSLSQLASNTLSTNNTDVKVDIPTHCNSRLNLTAKCYKHANTMYRLHGTVPFQSRQFPSFPTVSVSLNPFPLALGGQWNSEVPLLFSPFPYPHLSLLLVIGARK